MVPACQAPAATEATASTQPLKFDTVPDLDELVVRTLESLTGNDHHACREARRAGPLNTRVIELMGKDRNEALKALVRHLELLFAQFAVKAAQPGTIQATRLGREVQQIDESAQ